jgi:uncharacterized membrane protein
VKEFAKTTILGGVLFLLPAAFVLFVLSFALRLIKGLAAPIVHMLRLDHLGNVTGVGVVTVTSVFVLVLLSFVAGMIARTAVGKRVTRWSEKSLLGHIPYYQLVKGMAEGLAKIESGNGLKPVLVNIGASWQIGYMLEEQLEGGWIVALVPRAPSPLSGNIMYLPPDRVRPLGITLIQAMSIVKAMGAGSSAALRGVDLRLPSDDQ